MQKGFYQDLNPVITGNYDNDPVYGYNPIPDDVWTFFTGPAKEYFDGGSYVTGYTPPSNQDQQQPPTQRAGLISYPSETNGAWRNQKSFVNNKGDGSWDGLPDYLRHRNDDIDTTTYYR